MEFDKAYWYTKAAEISLPDFAVIDGKKVQSIAGETFVSVNPATGKELGRVPACSAEDVNRAVASSREAFEAGVWSRAQSSERKAVLLRLAELMRDALPELAVMESLDMGKLVRDAHGNDIANSISILQWHAEQADKLYDEAAQVNAGDTAIIKRVPLGVVGAVVPWNFPLNMAIWKCAPALVAGNSVVLKPAEQSPYTAIRFAELALEAGLPPGVLNVVTGYGETAGQALGRHMDVDCLAFTGSTEVGKMFLEYSGQSNMKQVWLECGGKSPAIVFDACSNLEEAADQVVSGIFYNQGQVCSATSRLLVQNSIRDQFLDLLLERVARYQPGDPLDPASGMGAMVDVGHVKTVQNYIEKGKREARLVVGGEVVAVNGAKCFVEPTIFVDVQPDHTIAREEIFGPVLSVIGFETEEQAVSMANDSFYGLAASVWTDDLRQAHRVSGKILAGVVAVNVVDPVSPMVPFGGFKQSGSGRDLSLHAVEKYMGLKTTWIRHGA